MGFFKRLFGDAAKEPKTNFEESRNEKVKEIKEMNNEDSDIQLDQPNETGTLFSTRLEAMIDAALQDGVLTDKEREILKRRVEKEGEDWDEVEMIIEARLAEMKPTASSTEIEVPNKTSTQQETERTAQSDSQEHKEEGTILEDELLDAKKLLPTIQKMIPRVDPEHLTAGAKIDAYYYLSELAEKSSELKLSISIYKKCAYTFMNSKDNEEAKNKVLQLLNIKQENNARPIAHETIVDQVTQQKSEPVSSDAEPILYGGGFADLLQWKHDKYEELKDARDHSNDSPEAKERFQQLNVEYDEIKKAQKKGAGTIDEVILAVQQSIGVRIKPSDSFVKSLKAKEEARKKVEEERKRVWEKARKDAEEVNKLLEESAKRNAEWAREQAEEEARRKARKALEEAEEEARKQAERKAVETKKKAEEEARKKFEEEKKNVEVVKKETEPEKVKKEVNTNSDYLPGKLWNDNFGVLYCGNRLINAQWLDTKVYHVKPGTKVICDNAFYSCKVERIVLPDSLLAIGEKAFYRSTRLNDVNIPQGITSIQRATFLECQALEEVILPDSVTRIGDEAFAGCKNLSSVNLPDNVSEIGEDAFRGTKLKEIIFPRELCNLKQLGWGLEKLRKLDFSKVTKLKIIPEDLIGDNAHKIKEIAIPIGVEIIEGDIGGDNLGIIFLPPTIKEVGDFYRGDTDIYCFSPAIEELEPLVEGIYDNFDENEYEEYAIRLHVLPEHLESYKSQRDAEDISEKVLVIDVIPEEFRYYYDN